MFPGIIQPLHEIRSKTKVYQAFYTVLGPLLPVLNRPLPNSVTTTEVGRAILKVAKQGAPKQVLDNQDINRE
jgi:hypothetical protein